MNKQTMMMALREIPRISKALQSGEANANEEMQIVIQTLHNSKQATQGQAMAQASTQSLLRAVQGREISEGMAKNIKESALSELSCRFRCEDDFKDQDKIKLLQELI